MNYKEEVLKAYPDAYCHQRHEYMPYAIFAGDKCLATAENEVLAWYRAYIKIEEEQKNICFD